VWKACALRFSRAINRIILSHSIAFLMPSSLSLHVRIHLSCLVSPLLEQRMPIFLIHTQQEARVSKSLDAGLALVWTRLHDKRALI
jgi:hypothetical protein